MRRHTKVLSTLGLLALITSLLSGLPALATHTAGIHSANVTKLGRHHPIEAKDGAHAKGTDLAFQGDLVLAGAYEGVGLFRRLAAKPFLKQISFYDCPGSQGDVSILGNFAFVSIDSPGSNSESSPVCNNTGTTGSATSPSSVGKEGIRIINISDPTRPRQVAFVETECGSHTHTLIPKGTTTYMYVDSYPLAQSTSCNDVNHPEGEFTVLRFPTNDPTKARIVSTPDVVPPTAPDAIGCHDTGVLPGKNLAVAACLGAFSVLNISDPAAPRVLSTVQNPAMELDHSGGLTWNGKVAVVSDEHAGAAGGGGCSTDQDSAVGAMWYYDISDPRNPVEKGHYSLPRVPPVDDPEEAERFRCTTHNWNILPMRNPAKYIAVSSYYSGGLSVVDFSDPTNPKELGFYLPQVGGKNPDMWSAYWYNGRIYSNEHASKLGLSVFRMKGLAKSTVRYFGGRLNPQTMAGPLR